MASVFTNSPHIAANAACYLIAIGCSVTVRPWPCDWYEVETGRASALPVSNGVSVLTPEQFSQLSD